MNWSDVAETVGRVAPSLGSMVAGAPGRAVGGMISSALGVDNTPDAVSKALESDPQAAVKLRQIEADMHAAVEQTRQAQLQAQTDQQRAINETMRAELSADGWFKSGWRPAIGWVMAAAFLMLSGAMAWGVLNDPSQLPGMIDGIITLVVAMGAVLGVNINARTKDKLARQTGERPPSFIEQIRTGGRR